MFYVLHETGSYILYASRNRLVGIKDIHTITAKPIKTLGLPYAMVQF